MKAVSLQKIEKMTGFGAVRAAFDHYARSTAARQTGPGKYVGPFNLALRQQGLPIFALWLDAFR
ncbi:MAG: hypothetical protein NWR54_03670 [Paracoccaceae bacterium]|jgi:hypothetical protein|nr:hypothetical protein [Paracoccaceae bacterium]